MTGRTLLAKETNMRERRGGMGPSIRASDCGSLLQRPPARSVTGLVVCMLIHACCVISTATAQNASVSGFVTNRSDNQPLELVNVTLTQEGDLVAGTVTTLDGLFLLTGVRPGRYVLKASFVGYEPYADTLELEAGETRSVAIALAPDEAALGEVVVESERESGAARITAGRQTIRPADIDLIPTPDLAGDLVSYLSTLPGIVSTGDRGGQLYIRGGEPSQNLVMLDGMLLYQPFHVLGFYSAFPSDILSRADVYAGGYGARFGERISSVIDAHTRTGNKRRFVGAASLSPFIGTFRLEGPLVPDRVSFLMSGRESMIERGAEPMLNEDLPFEFGDYFAKIHANVSSRSRLSIRALSTHDRGTLRSVDDGSAAEEIRWKNRAAGLRYLLLPSFVPISADLRVSHTRHDAELGTVDAPARTSSISNTSISLDGNFLGDRSTVEAGFALRFISSLTELGGLFQNTEIESVGVDHIAFYVEPEYRFGSLKVRPGLRAQWFAIRIDPYLEPRLRLVWTLGTHEISGAAGYYVQEIVGLTDRRDAANVFTAWTNIPKRNPSQPDVLAENIPGATHAILGYRANPAPWLELSMEGFYKWLDNLFVSEWTAFPRFTTRLQPATGRSFGFDARLEVRRTPYFYGYVNYGFSNTRYRARQASLELWYGRETLDFRPPHDRRHQLNALISTRLKGFDLSLRWSFGSGLPFSRALGFDGFVQIDDVVNVMTAPHSRRVLYERPYNAVLPTYHRLDVSLDRTFVVGPIDVTVMGSIINVYDRRNLFYLDVFTLQRVDQLPFIPSLGIKVSVE